MTDLVNNDGKPRFILDIQKHLGLECRLIEESKNSPSPQYEVISPTGVVMFKVGGSDSDIVGMVSMPHMYDIQGVDREERQERRRKPGNDYPTTK